MLRISCQERSDGRVTGCLPTRTTAVLILLCPIASGQQPVLPEPRLMDELRSGIAQAAHLPEQAGLNLKCLRTETIVTTDLRERALLIEKYGDSGQPPAEAFECHILGTRALKSGTNQLGLRYIMARNERYAFSLTQPEGHASWSVQFLAETTAPDAQQEIRHVETEVKPVVFAPWYVFGVRLSELLDDPRFTIMGIRERHDSGRRLVDVDCEYAQDFGSGRVRRFTNAQFTCDPRNFWAVTHFFAESFREENGERPENETGYSWETFIECQRTPDGIPITRSTRRVLSSVPPDPNNGTITVTNVQILEEKPQPDCFYLSCYGLDEPTFQTPWYRSGWVLLVIGGIVTGTGLILLRRFQKQHR